MRFATVISAGVTAGLLSVGPRAASAQRLFEGEIGLRTPTGPLDVTVKGDKARINTQSQMGPVGIIFNGAAHEIYLVLDAQRMIMVMKAEDAAQMIDSTLTASAGTGSIVALGRTDRVAEIECAMYRYVGTTSAEDICVATGLGNLGVFGMFRGMGMGRGRPSAGQAPGWAGALAQQGGIPLRIADTTGVVRFEVTRLERKAVADSLVNPPASYQRMQMPGGMRPPGN